MAFRSSAIRMAMDTTHIAMDIPMVTDTGMGQDTTDMATATMATATPAMASTAVVITLAIAPMEVDQALSVCSDNYRGPVIIVAQSTE